jgi:lipopolysaccharide/colanic/teichoic acid biosynthesis glycosyltransferase
MNQLSIRLLDIIFSLAGLICLLPVLAILFLIGFFDTGSPLFIQTRVGRYQKPFKLIKFRTMSIQTESVATHLACASSVTKFGGFLRRTKLDELPQLLNVLAGQMSLVGPRPCLFNQAELIKERGNRGVFLAKPGITGLAQVSDIDMSTPRKLARYDQLMLKHLNSRNYLYLIVLTAIGNGASDKIKL